MPPAPTQGPASESLVALLFVAIVLAVFGAALVLLRRFVAVKRRPLGPAGRALVALAAIGILCIAYGRLVEPRWLEVTHTRVPTRNLPAGHRGVRIVHLSDVHSDPEPRFEERLPDGPAIVVYHCPFPDLVAGELAPRVDLFCAATCMAARWRCPATAP